MFVQVYSKHTESKHTTNVGWGWRSVQLSLSDTLAGHLLPEVSSMRLPSSSLLYDTRITLDMASMLWARETIFSRKAHSKRPFVLHLRADSSPQFGRDFLIVQCDVVHCGATVQNTEIKKRLLPIQCVGSRAASAPQKLSKLVHSLSLESEHVPWCPSFYFLFCFFFFMCCGLIVRTL